MSAHGAGPTSGVDDERGRGDGGPAGLAGWMLGVFVLATAVRLAFVLLGPGWEMPEQHLGGDPADYHGIAVSLYEGDGFAWEWPGTGPDAGERAATATRAPGFPALLATLYRVTGPSPQAGRLLLLVVDALTAVLLVRLGSRLAGRRVGIAAGLLAAVYPALWVNVGTLMSEVPTTFLVVVSLLAAERLRRTPTAGWVVAAGLAGGATALTRPNGLLVAAVLIGWTALVVRPGVGVTGCPPPARGRPWWSPRRWLPDPRRAAAAALVCALVVATLVVPWVVRNQREVGVLAPITTQGGFVLAGIYSSEVTDLETADWGGWDVVLVLTELFAAPDEATVDQRLRERAREWIVSHPREALWLVGLHAVRYLDTYWALDDRRATHTPTRWDAVNGLVVVSWWLVAGLAIAGLVRLGRAGALWRWVPGLAVWLGFLGSGLLLAAATRYRAPSEPVVVLLAAVVLGGWRPGVGGEAAHPRGDDAEGGGGS